MSQTHSFKGTARAIVTDKEGNKAFIYHRTAVVTRCVDGSIILNSDGWRTATTKTAMNQASNEDQLGFQVFQTKGEWFVNFRNTDLVFEDGMTLV